MNATHVSRTDPDAMLYKKGPGMEAKPCFIGHGLMENRSGLIVDARLTRVSGHAERLAALEMIERHADRPGAITLGADRGYDAADFVEKLRELNVRPHVARNTNGRRSAIDGRTTRHAGYAASQRIRKRIEEAFGGIKTVAGLRKTKLRGLARVDWAFTFAAAVRLPRLLEAPTWPIRWPANGASPRWSCGTARSSICSAPATSSSMTRAAASSASERSPACSTAATPRPASTSPWEGNDEMDDASGEGYAELQDDGSLNGDISFHDGDESTFTGTSRPSRAEIIPASKIAITSTMERGGVGLGPSARSAACIWA